MTQLGPVPCQGCRTPVVWTGRWRNVGQRGRGRHVCPEDRPACGAWMKQAKERCARRPGHKTPDHRTRYALDNQARHQRLGWCA